MFGTSHRMSGSGSFKPDLRTLNPGYFDISQCFYLIRGLFNVFSQKKYELHELK